MKKKIVSALLCVAMLSTMLAGCGGSGGKSSKADGDKPYSGEKLTVLFMSGVYAEAAESMVDEFEEKTGATVEVVDFPYTTLHEKTLLDLTSGTGSYDVVDVASQWDGEFAPYLTDLSDFMDKDNYKTDEFIEKVLENSGECREFRQVFRMQVHHSYLPTEQIYYQMDFRIHGKNTEKLQKS